MTLLAILVVLINVSTAQYTNNFVYEWITPQNCAENEVYNPISFKCKTCDADKVANPQRDDCICKASLKTILDTQQNRCIACAQGQGTKLIDEVNVCVDCFDVNGNRVNANSNGSCPLCPLNSISTFYTIQNNGFGLGREVCSVCPPNTEPNSDKNSCISCKSRECICSKNSTFCGDINQDEISPLIYTDITQTFFSALIEKEAMNMKLSCQLSNLDACQGLANLCVLQNYNRDQNTVCTLLDSLRNNQNNELIPPITYANTEASVELFRETAIDATFNVEENADNNELDLQLAVFHFNGTFLGLHSIKKGLLQVCPAKLEAIQGAFKFGRLYSQNCDLGALEAFEKIREIQSQFDPTGSTVFYELYLRYRTQNGQLMMYNVPIVNEDIRHRDEYINRLSSDSRWLLTRRFFLADKQLDVQNKAQLIRVYTHISLNIRFQLSRDGRIFPPYARIRYNQYYEMIQSLDILNRNEQKTHFQFQINYIIDTFRHDKTIEVLMATFCSCSVLAGAFRAYSWSRRAGKMVIDAATILTFILNVADNIGNVFILIMGCTSIWITFAYKLQHHLVYIPLAYEQEWSFVAYVISATALKFVTLIYTYLTLIFTETFFVDWERPRSGIDRSRETTMLEISNNDMTSQKLRRTVPIVIWRTYLIANEWNELQHYRKTSIALQLISTLLLLEWCHFGDYAIIQPGFDRNVNIEEYAETRMSRFAIDITIYLAIALSQWIITVLIIEKMADPFRNFMDLCSVANISVLAFTHPLRAYYIHGRSIHGMADTDMLEMNMFLQREKENLCGLRGLESNSELQTFIVCLPKSFREKLDELTSAMRNAARTTNVRSTNDRVTTKVETTAKIHAEITQFVKDFIDHTDPNIDYVVTEARLIEDVLDIELSDTSRVGSFIRDHSEMAYSSVFIYGNEWAHLAFEMLMFSVIDMATHSRILSAAIVYAISVTIRTLSKSLFTNSLVKSSLVDHRFLI